MPNYAKIKGRLREKGYSQADLARHLGIAVATINQKLNGCRPFTLDEADRIADFLEIADVEFGAYFFDPHSA